MSEINCNNCAVSDFKESLCHRCAEMKRLGRAEDIEGLLIKAFSEVDSPAKSDCIDRQAAIDVICKACSMEGDYHKCDGYPETSTWCDELVALRALPSAQPEIIRCKDCKHKHIENMVWTCPFGLPGGENFFCGYGAEPYKEE